MSRLSVRLFGKLSVRWDGQEVDGLTASKVQELFCFLLLHRHRPQSREALASLLWGDSSTAHSRKYLRQALWQLQVALKCDVAPAEHRLLRIESEWVHLNGATGLWLDVADFEHAAAMVQGVPSENLDARTVSALQAAVDLYDGDLLQGCYQDWCLYERERLQGVYLTMLDKLMGYSESHELLDAGLQYGAVSLRYDRARECTHQRLMRMHFLAGDRAAALRQYDRCVVALDEELGVKPSEVSVALYEQISAGRLRAPSPAPSDFSSAAGPGATTLAGVLGHLRQLDVVLARVQEQLHQNIQIVEAVLIGQTRPDGVERRGPVRSGSGSHPPGSGQKPATGS